jgi:hypothetical protein
MSKNTSAAYLGLSREAFWPVVPGACSVSVLETESWPVEERAPFGLMVSSDTRFLEVHNCLAEWRRPTRLKGEGQYQPALPVIRY